jgi:hypothetical protein
MRQSISGLVVPPLAGEVFASSRELDSTGTRPVRARIPNRDWEGARGDSAVNPSAQIWVSAELPSLRRGAVAGIAAAPAEGWRGRRAIRGRRDGGGRGHGRATGRGASRFAPEGIRRRDRGPAAGNAQIGGNACKKKAFCGTWGSQEGQSAWVPGHSRRKRTTRVVPEKINDCGMKRGRRWNFE